MPAASMGPRPKARKKGLDRDTAQGIDASASMGPRPKARKNDRRGHLLSGESGPFNGAAPEGAEERAGRPSPTEKHRSFNGAAPEGAEEPFFIFLTPVTLFALQWGRARRRGRTHHRAFRHAALHRLQWGRARRRGRTQRPAPTPAGSRAPSMGPRPKARKNGADEPRRRGQRHLQWGRARRRGRTRLVPLLLLIQVSTASMGPRPKARKNGIGTAPTATATPASMGPRPKARKNRASGLQDR